MATAPREAREPQESDYLDPRWRAVSRGLGRIRGGILAALVGTILLIGARIWWGAHVAFAEERGNPEPLADVGVGLCVLAEFAVLVVACALVLLGRLSCRRLPRETKLRGLLLASVWLTVLGGISFGLLLLLAVLAAGSHLGGGVFGVLALLGLGCGLFGLAAEGVFLTFLSRVGHQVRSLELVSAVRTFTLLLGAALLGGLLVGCGLGGAVALLGPVPVPQAPRPGRMPPGGGPLEGAEWLPGLFVLSGLGAAVVAFLLAVAYLNLLRLARENIDDRLPAPEPVLPEPGRHYLKDA
jgi:hypothetical protein